MLKILRKDEASVMEFHGLEVPWKLRTSERKKSFSQFDVLKKINNLKYEIKIMSFKTFPLFWVRKDVFHI